MAIPVTDVGAFLTYAAAMSITPGPNNAMLATLGARHGWRGAAPAAAGVMAGSFVLLVTAGTGLGAVVAAAPRLKAVLLLAGVAYMAYLAWVLWRSDLASPGQERPPVGFWGAVAFQAVNPKGLLMALTAAGGFLLPATGPLDALAMALMFMAVSAPCIAAWALLGDRLRGWLAAPHRARAFSRAMACLVAVTAVAMVLEG